MLLCECQPNCPVWELRGAQVNKPLGHTCRSHYCGSLDILGGSDYTLANCWQGKDKASIKINQSEACGRTNISLHLTPCIKKYFKGNFAPTFDDLFFVTHRVVVYTCNWSASGVDNVASCAVLRG